MAEDNIKPAFEPPKPNVAADERIDFFRERAFLSLHVKTDRWNRFIAAEENQKVLFDFLEKTDHDRLILYTGPGGALQIVDTQIITPILANANNHTGWPHVVSEDIKKQLEKLKSKMILLRGKAEGRTLLPLPMAVEQSEETFTRERSGLVEIDSTLLYSIETMMIQWIHQISDVLKKDSSDALLQGDNPGPSTELDFWLMQKENLLGIQQQIQDPKVTKIIEILRRIKSSYYAAFSDIIQKVNQAVLEAEDIELHLRPLKRHIAVLEECSFADIDHLITPLFHTLCLIWTHSQYYCCPPRIVVLLQKFCNLLIERAFVYLIPEELFKMELEEGMEKVHRTILTIQSFKKCFHQHKDQLHQYYPEGVEVKTWNFPSYLIFTRMDRILERLMKIETLFASALDFLKLERIEIGGCRGKILSEMVYSMNEEFHESWRALRESKYDPLDYEQSEFLSDYTRLMEQNKDFDQRLGTVLNLAFRDSRGLESAFKLLQIFGTLLERPLVNQLFAPNVAVLLAMFEAEVNCCWQIVESQRDKLPGGREILNKNMPSISGNLKWSQELRERIMSHLNNFRQLSFV
ncbi:DYH11 protein, partial [Polypterus senegalus]|nr:DYH11 protein [Polypterus senegalus]